VLNHSDRYGNECCGSSIIVSNQLNYFLSIIMEMKMKIIYNLTLD
jgi:hypothetical protein